MAAQDILSCWIILQKNCVSFSCLLRLIVQAHSKRPKTEIGMIISCKEASRLASLKLERKLTLKERFMFRVHLAYCIACRRMERQFQFISQAMGAWMSRED